MKKPGNFNSSDFLIVSRLFVVAFFVSGVIILIYELFENVPTGIFPSWLDHFLTILFISATVAFFACLVRKRQDEYNRKLRNMNNSVIKNQEKYRMLFGNLPFCFQLNEIIYDEKGNPSDFRNIEVNKRFQEISGTKRGNVNMNDLKALFPDKGSTSKFIRVGVTGIPFCEECYSEISEKYLRVSAYSPEPGQFAVITEDITIRKQSEERQLLLGKVLQILNTRYNWANSIRDILHEIRLFSKFDAVGIRIEKDNDFPYYASEGLSDEFLIKENSICARLKDGSVRFNNDGQPVLECTCGMVISGKVPEESYITRKGSLWTNNSGEFLDMPDIEDSRLNPRNTCIHHGYQSVMLVPLKNDDRIIGLLQMNSREPGKFTPEDIAFFEELGHTISLAYGRALNETIIMNSRVEIAKNEENLRAAEKVTRTLLNASGSINILVNASDYTILDINRAGSLLFGSHSEDIRGTNATNLFRQISDVFHDKLNEALQESKTVRFQEEKSEKYFYNQIYPIKNESGEIHCLAVFIQDISEIRQIRELRELNNELSELNATKDRLFSVLGHDLRSPLSGILNLAELLEKNIERYEPAKSASFIRSILVTSYQVLNLLDNLTIWAKSRRGQIEFSPVFFRLAGIIPEVTEVMQSAATNKRIRIISNIADDVMCYADINMITCILRNLVQNAIKFTNSEGWIKIDAAILPGNIEISVSDNGIGMNNELKQSLFKMNTPVSVQGTSKEKGSGIGLLLCSEFIVRHSGTIAVESEPGNGSRFIVTLPFPENNLCGNL